MPKAASPVLLVLGVIGLTVSAVQGQQSKQLSAQQSRSSSLSVQDYLDIQQLANRYSYALDTGADQGRMYANLFAPDGVFGQLVGRNAIAKMAYQHMPEQGPRYVKHLAMNHVIEPSRDGAIGQQYIVDVMFGEADKPSALSLGGVYHDQYVKTPEGWRFKTRKFAGSKAGPEAVAAGPALSLDPQRIAPPSAAHGGHLTADDYLEIQHLVNRYAYALDTGAGTGAMYSHLFTLDGVFGRSIGRDAIEKMAWQHMPEQGPLYAKHFLANHVIEPTATGATGKEYVLTLAVGEGGKPTTITTGGIYDDVYEKTADGWRFKTRRFVGAKPAADPAAPQAAKTASAASVAPGKSSERSGKSSKLGPSDYLEIQQLAARSAYAIDNAADGGTTYADLFVPTGTLSEQGRTYERREQLAEFARSAQRPSVFHFITNQVIEPSAEGASSQTYVASFTIGASGQPNTVGGGGRYEDVYVRTVDGWRLKSRMSLPSKAGPQP